MNNKKIKWICLESSIENLKTSLRNSFELIIQNETTKATEKLFFRNDGKDFCIETNDIAIMFCNLIDTLYRYYLIKKFSERYSSYLLLNSEYSEYCQKQYDRFICQLLNVNANMFDTAWRELEITNLKRYFGSENYDVFSESYVKTHSNN